MVARYIGAGRTAAYLGKTTGTLHNYCKKAKKIGFPGPDSEHLGVQGDDSEEIDKIDSRGWLPESLPMLRAWCQQYDGWTDEYAKEQWKAIDETLPWVDEDGFPIIAPPNPENPKPRKRK